MKLQVEVYQKDVEEFSNELYIDEYKTLYGFIDGYVTINENVYAIVYFEKFYKICKIPITKIIAHRYIR